MTPRELLEAGMRTVGIEVAEPSVAKLLDYTALLSKWNRTYNLTAIRDPLGVVTHHLLDSLSAVPHLPLAAGAHIADVGSGGGLPGIPLAIARPQWHVTVNDSSEKKAAFLRQAAIELALPNLAVHEGRVENWRPAQRFALVVSRAFAELGRFLAACAHLVEEGGWLAAMKGGLSHAEMATAPRQCSCRALRLEVPFLSADRHLVLCKRSA